MMVTMATVGKRRFNWIVLVTGVVLFGALWPTIGFVWSFAAALAGVIMVLVIQDAVRRRMSA
jgi:hypothetical protein